MSSSNTTSSSKTHYLKYQNKLCGCGLRAAVKISESDKNPGRLYYGCSKDAKDKQRCSYFEWCNPVGYHNQGNPDVAAETIYREDKVLELNLERNDARVQVLEANVSNLKYMVNVIMFLSGLAMVMAIIALAIIALIS